MTHADVPPHWSEDDSQLYRKLAPVAVPGRAEQLAILLALLPFGPADSFHAVEIGAGEGLLSAALLTAFPRATVTALDGSASMRAQLRARLHPFGSRAGVEPFNLTGSGWYPHLQNADAALSSLCLHHLSGPEKQTLFAEIARRLTARGALLIADLVEPQHPAAQSLYAETWDRSVREQSLAQTGGHSLHEVFEQTAWNLYRYPDPVDKPSPLFHQLAWLRDAGFTAVDCFWMKAGHAIYGGYKPAAGPGHLFFEVALAAVKSCLKTTGPE